MRTFSFPPESADQSARAAPVLVGLERVAIMIPFLAIFGAALSGYASVGPWVIALAALALIAVSHAEYGATYSRAEQVGASAELGATITRSIANAVVTTAGAYCTGFLVHLL